VRRDSFATPPAVGVADRCKTRRCIPRSIVWRCDGVVRWDRSTLAIGHTHTVTASRRLNGVSPNPNPRSVEVGDILLCGHRGIRSLRHLVPSRLPCRVTSTSTTVVRNDRQTE
jgi:hypothetical protein